MCTMHTTLLSVVEVETLTAILGKTIQPRQVTTASLLEGIMISRAQGPKTPLLSRSRRSLATTPTLGSSDGTPLPSNLSVFGKKLMSSSTRTPSRTITGAYVVGKEFGGGGWGRRTRT